MSNTERWVGPVHMPGCSPGPVSELSRSGFCLAPWSHVSCEHSYSCIFGVSNLSPFSRPAHSSLALLSPGPSLPHRRPSPLSFLVNQLCNELPGLG